MLRNQLKVMNESRNYNKIYTQKVPNTKPYRIVLTKPVYRIVKMCTGTQHYLFISVASALIIYYTLIQPFRAGYEYLSGWNY